MNPPQNPEKKIGSVTIIGGGVAGIQAALDVAASGFKVHLVEEQPSIGGVMAQLDKTFPTNDCSACMLGPKLVESVNHPHIEILTYTDLVQIEGDPGRFTVTLKKKARAVSPERCVGCGVCAEKCPVDVSDAFNLNLTKRKAVYLPYPQAVPLVYTIDKKYCRYFTKGKCRLCEQFCEHKAIIFDQEDEVVQLETGAVILAGGSEPFDARLKGEYGYGRWPNVITSLEYERMLSASGPFQGHIQRISDGKKPRRLAWIQCVGSRDSHMGRKYCSSVCCMYATKQAMITKEHDPTVETTIFCLDVRAHGKGFDRFYERSKTENNVRYVRSLISRIVPNPEDDTLQIAYAAPGNQLLEATYDMIVLSIGLCPSRSIKQLAKQIGFQLNPHGFSLSDPLNSEITSKEGLYVCGVTQEPKDIPDAVQQGSSAAAHAMSLLAEVKGSLISSPPEITERDVTGEEPRIGVFVCHCGINIAGVVDVEGVTDFARTLPDVKVATHCMFACSSDQQEEIKKIIKKQGLNRVVVASCTPRTHEPLFRDTLRQAGLNPYLFELANIREHDSWVHRADPEAATQKAKDLVAMSTSRARLLKPLVDIMFPVVQTGLVIGGGLAGLTSALTLAEQGYETVLVERNAQLGGNARTLHYTEEGTGPAEHVQKLIQSVNSEPLITVYTEAELTSIKGSCGNFMSTVQVQGKTKDIAHGVVLVATGGEEYIPEEYHYGQHPGVITQKEFETLLVSQTERARQLKHVVMIQCVGSREPDHLYCSKVCCTAAIKNSIKLKELNPGADISILYRDIRTFGFKENYYLQSRLLGVRFYRFKRERKPEVTFQDPKFNVSVLDDDLQTPVQLTADLLVLSAAIRPREENKQLADIIRLPLDEDGFFMEAHPKLRPLDFSKTGLYLCGLAQGPKFAKEAITQARGAVARSTKVLSRKMLVAEGMITHIDPNLCRACRECENTCLFEAVKVKEVGEGRKRAVVTESLCTGCGACNAACPTCAASLAHFQDDQINVMISKGF